ncbi:43853_t:CDS:2 [Gigaspora margarita]|uniref:43853_t:CDS:1 n=1 Tax=Gigaspora margarita TaxID=4874 RepID=A0ABN7UUL6_GIGMA|nr:43853_t:CDS:2 [Gigaspora margarita]
MYLCALNKANTEKNKKIRKLSSTIFQFKNDKKDIKKLAKASIDSTIEPSSFNNFYETKFWTRRYEDTKNNLNI